MYPNTLSIHHIIRHFDVDFTLGRFVRIPAGLIEAELQELKIFIIYLIMSVTRISLCRGYVNGGQKYSKTRVEIVNE